MTGWFLAFLVGASLAVAVPAGVRARRSTPFSTAQLFKKRMSMMAPRSRGGRWVIVPDGHAAAQARAIERETRRRQSRTLMGLFVVALATGIWAVVMGGAAIPVHVGVDIVMLAYAIVVVRTRRRQAERRRKVMSMARHQMRSSASSWRDVDRGSMAL